MSNPHPDRAFEEPLEGRLERERGFFNDAPEEDRCALGKYYELARSGSETFAGLLSDIVPGRRVLEIGCGDGSLALTLARRGARVDAIDISDARIAQARRIASADDLDVTFHVMNAEELAFAAETFDVVCGRAIVHHLDVDRACREIARTLAPDGRMVILEPLGHNPAINLFRRRTPGLRTPDEHPLLMSDIAQIRRLFDRVDLRFLNLTCFAALPFRRLPWYRRLVDGLDALDERLLRLPLFGRYAWRILVDARAPRSSPRAGAGADTEAALVA